MRLDGLLAAARLVLLRRRHVAHFENVLLAAELVLCPYSALREVAWPKESWMADNEGGLGRPALPLISSLSSFPPTRITLGFLG